MKPGKKPTECEKRDIRSSSSLSRCHPHTLGLSLSSPLPTQVVVPPPGQWTQPEHSPLSEAWSSCSQWAPAPSLGPQEVPVPPTGCRGRGASGVERGETAWQGEHAEQPRGVGAK